MRSTINREDEPPSQSSTTVATPNRFQYSLSRLAEIKLIFDMGLNVPYTIGQRLVSRLPDGYFAFFGLVAGLLSSFKIWVTPDTVRPGPYPSRNPGGGGPSCGIVSAGPAADLLDALHEQRVTHPPPGGGCRPGGGPSSLTVSCTKTSRCPVWQGGAGGVMVRAAAQAKQQQDCRL